STFQASSASRPVVAASPFMTQAPVNTSAVLASTYVPVTDTGLAASVANIRLERPTESTIFFMTPSTLAGQRARATSQLAAVPSLTTAVGPNRLPVGAERRLRQHTPVRGRLIGIVQRRLERIHRGVDIHLLRAQLEAVHARRNFRRDQRF